MNLIFDFFNSSRFHVFFVTSSNNFSCNNTHLQHKCINNRQVQRTPLRPTRLLLSSSSSSRCLTRKLISTTRERGIYCHRQCYYLTKFYILSAIFYYVLLSTFIIPNVNSMSTTAFVAASRRFPACIENGNCEQFLCQTGKEDAMAFGDLPSPLTTSFTAPCTCDHQWNVEFCNNTKIYNRTRQQSELMSNVELLLPNICICRKIYGNSASSKCEQFMVRCFGANAAQNKSCHCCFNQPNEHCRQLNCTTSKDGKQQQPQPDFGDNNDDSSIVCECFDSIAYPFHICTDFDRRRQEQSTMTTKTLSTSANQLSTVTNDDNRILIIIGGISITPLILVTFVATVLGIIVIFLLVLLVIGSCRLSAERRERIDRRQQVRTALIDRRAEDDKYLP